VVQRGLGVSQTRLIFQQSIIPEYLWPCATDFQRDVLLKHMSHAISFDHTFKLARFGVYNDIVNQRAHNATDNPSCNASQTTRTANKVVSSVQ
jgi:hypothetical protein